MLDFEWRWFVDFSFKFLLQQLLLVVVMVVILFAIAFVEFLSFWIVQGLKYSILEFICWWWSWWCLIFTFDFESYSVIIFNFSLVIGDILLLCVVIEWDGLEKVLSNEDDEEEVEEEDGDNISCCEENWLNGLEDKCMFWWLSKWVGSDEGRLAGDKLAVEVISLELSGDDNDKSVCFWNVDPKINNF